MDLAVTSWGEKADNTACLECLQLQVFKIRQLALLTLTNAQHNVMHTDIQGQLDGRNQHGKMP